jgi:hypothetical protein
MRSQNVLTFAVHLRGGDGSSRVVWFRSFRDANPGVFSLEDERELRAGKPLDRLGCVVSRTTDQLCILCGRVVGEGCLRCHACEHREEGPGYRVAVPVAGVQARLFQGRTG